MMAVESTLPERTARRMVIERLRATLFARPVNLCGQTASGRADGIHWRLLLPDTQAFGVPRSNRAHFTSIFQFSAQLYSYYQLALQFYDSKSRISLLD
jgi:hypothetical protein